MHTLHDHFVICWRECEEVSNIMTGVCEVSLAAVNSVCVFAFACVYMHACVFACWFLNCSSTSICCVSGCLHHRTGREAASQTVTIV